MDLFPSLSEAQLAGAKLDAAAILHKNNFFKTSPAALGYVEETLREFTDDQYRRRFLRIFAEIHETRYPGIALSPSVIKTIYGKMQLKRSVLMFVKGREHDNSVLKNAVRNAVLIFAAMPASSKTNL